MINKNPKYRKSISSSQVRLLEILFKFRFSTVPLISEWMKKDKSTLYERLLVLVEQGYVRKNYDSTYRLPPRPATYSLAPKGINYLRKNNPDDRYSDAALRNMYKNKRASASLIDRSIDVFKLCLLLRKQYTDTFSVFAKSEIFRLQGVVRPLPDMYLRRTNVTSDADSLVVREYMLDIVDSWTMSWILKKRLRAHQKVAEGSDLVYPVVLFICGNNSTERRIQKMVENEYFEFEVWTTARERLESGEMRVWRDNWDEEEVVLRSL